MQLKSINFKKGKKSLGYFDDSRLEFLEKDRNGSLQGLKFYVNTVLKNWRVRNCFGELTKFISKYINTVVCKLTDHVKFRH